MDTIQTYQFTESLFSDLMQSYVWAFVGAAFMMLYKVYDGWKNSERTPEMFSFRELFYNPKNVVRFVLTGISIAIVINFMPDLLAMTPNAFNGLLIGLSSSQLADAIASKQNLVPNKIKGK